MTMKTIAAILLLLTAGVLAVFELIALIDPRGTKMADDGDPFGAPVPWHVHAIWITVILLVVASAVVLLQRRKQYELDRKP
jgi:hypothetical protein